jgi:tetratricopeptide (TPR) repeat protein
VTPARAFVATLLGVALGTGLVGFAPGVRAEDPWYELYQDALKSISSRKWAEAERRLKAAMSSGPAPGRQVRMYGVRSIDYLPEYQLGLVYFNQKRYADALEQFARVQTSGIVGKNDPEFQPLTDMLELCRIRTAPARAEDQREAELLVRLARDMMTRGSLEEARRALESARTQHPQSTDVVTALMDLTRLETEERLRTEQQRASAEQARKTEQDRALEGVRRSIEAGAFGEARAQLARLPASDPRVKEAAGEIAFREGLSEARQLAAAGRWSDAEARRRRLETSRPGSPELRTLAALIERGRAGSISPTPTPPPPSRHDAAATRTAYEAFYSGRYESAATAFAALAGEARSGKGRLLLYEACSRAAWALLRGQEGASELARARALYGEAGADAGRWLATDKLVSPAVRRALAP